MSCGHRQYYYIKSQMNDLYLDVENANTRPGTPISTWPKNGTDAQKFYDDPATKTIRSKLNDFCMDTEGGRLVLNPYKQCKPKQRWIRNGKLITNSDDANIALDICEENKRPRAKVIEYQVHYGKNQLWTFEMI